MSSNGPVIHGALAAPTARVWAIPMELCRDGSPLVLSLLIPCVSGDAPSPTLLFLAHGLCLERSAGNLDGQEFWRWEKHHGATDASAALTSMHSRSGRQLALLLAIGAVLSIR